jgi:lysophospholipase L1-like esterase/MoaA/NifB/PqqE/SkfB family radical SAM enzyme
MENPCKILFFGDSITKKVAPEFGEILKKDYPDIKLEIVNAGVISDTTRDGLKRIDKLLPGKPQVVVIGFGMNDWRKGVEQDEYGKNLSIIIDEFKKIGSRIILMTINPDYQSFMKGSSKVIDEYNCIIRDLARKYRIKVADVNSLWKRRFKSVQKGLRDQIHPNRKGYEIFYEALLHVVPQAHTLILWQYNGRECKCNYRCPYCYYSYSPRSENYFWGRIEDWHTAFKKSFGDQNLIFYLAFGEPTLGEAFYDVVKMIEGEPNWNLRITTNLSQDLERLLNTQLAKEGRLNINASFHPTQIKIEKFLKKLEILREHGIESPVVYVMWPPHFKRFEDDFKIFNSHNFLVHVRRFKGDYNSKHYPEAYTDSERLFVAKYCDDATIKYMLNEKPVFDRRTYSGLHFYIVDSTGNVGLDSDCFFFYSEFRTIFGNIIQDHMLKLPFEPQEYPEGCVQGTVDGVSNYLETGYHQLEGNNVLHFAKQGGVFRSDSGVHYKNLDTDFNDSRVRAEYYFPPRNLKDKFNSLMHMGIGNYIRGKFNGFHKVTKFGVKNFKTLVNR